MSLKNVKINRPHTLSKIEHTPRALAGRPLWASRASLHGDSQWAWRPGRGSPGPTVPVGYRGLSNRQPQGARCVRSPWVSQHQCLRRTKKGLDCSTRLRRWFMWTEAKPGLSPAPGGQSENGNVSLLVGTVFRRVFRAELQIHRFLPVCIWEAVCRVFLQQPRKATQENQKLCPPHPLPWATSWEPLFLSLTTLQSQWCSLKFPLQKSFCFASEASYRLIFLPGFLSLAIFCLAGSCLSFFQHKNRSLRETILAHPLHLHHPKWRVCVCVCVCVKSLNRVLTLCNPMDCSPPGSFVRGIFQARILAWVANSHI